MGQDPLSPRPRVVRRRSRTLSGQLLPPRPVLPEGGRHVRGRERPGAEDRLRSILFRHARRLGGARPAAGRRLRRPAHPGGARRRARLAQERLGRLSRRRLFPRHRRTAPIRPVGARRRARRRGRRPPGGVSRLHPILCRFAGDRRHADRLRADGGAVDRRRLPLRAQARQGRDDGHRVRPCSCAPPSRASASRR